MARVLAERRAAEIKLGREDETCVRASEAEPKGRGSHLQRLLQISLCREENQTTAMNEVGDVIIDVECLTQPPEICCSGRPKMSKGLSRKGSIRMERHTGGEQEAYDALKNLVKAVPSRMEKLKQPLVPFKTLQAVQSAPNSPAFSDLGEGRTKRLNCLTTIHPRKILLVFVAMSSIGTMVLIYFTLAIRRIDGA